MPTVVFCPERFSAVEIVELPPCESQRVADESGETAPRLLDEKLCARGPAFAENVKLERTFPIKCSVLYNPSDPRENGLEFIYDS